MTARRVRDCAAPLAASLLVLMFGLAGCARAPQPVAATPPLASTAAAGGLPTSASPSGARPAQTSTVPITPSATKPAAVQPSARSTITGKPVPTHSIPAGLATLPVRGFTGGSTQAITVAAAAGATQARLQAWNRTAGGWVRYGPEVAAWLGSAGLTNDAREGFSGTPIGSFALTHAFGNYADPGTRLPYFQAGPDDWWSGDVGSRTYNTHQQCAGADCPFDTGRSENLYEAGSVYGYAVVIDYNTAPVVAGRGSAFFLHISQGQPTEGCVSIPQDALVRIMRWLDPSRQPRIIMGPG